MKQNEGVNLSWRPGLEGHIRRIWNDIVTGWADCANGEIRSAAGFPLRPDPNDWDGRELFDLWLRRLFQSLPRRMETVSVSINDIIKVSFIQNRQLMSVPHHVTRRQPGPWSHDEASITIREFYETDPVSLINAVIFVVFILGQRIDSYSFLSQFILNFTLEFNPFLQKQRSVSEIFVIDSGVPRWSWYPI